MKVAHGLAHMPLTPTESEAMRVLWNNFVAEWNRRERARTELLPCSSQEWSAINTIAWSGPRNQAHFRPKYEPEWVWYRLYMRRGWRQFHNGWNFCRHEIAPTDLVRGERLVFLQDLPRPYPGTDRYPALRAVRQKMVRRLEAEPDFWRTGDM